MTSTHPRPTRPRPIAELVAGCLGPALAEQGFADAEILTRWPEIAGSELARRASPVKLQWPARRGGTAASATLVVRVESAFALELQQQAPVLIERLNAYLGWGCVGTLRLKQGVVARPAPRHAALRPVDAEAEERVRHRVGGIEDRRLAEALVRLGCEVARGR